MMNNDSVKQYVIIGAGGHAAVIADILYKCGHTVKGFLSDDTAAGTKVLDNIVLGNLDSWQEHRDCLFIIGVGDNSTRERIAQTYPMEYGIAIHPSVVMGSQVEVGRGSVIMAGCIINPRTIIGEHCIINTSASLDHDNKIGDFAHISPGVTLAGAVSIGRRTHIGTGSCVKNNISVCDDVIIGAGASVVRDIIEPGTYVGVPARKIK